MATRTTIVTEDFAAEMERALRDALPDHVKDIRVTTKGVYVGLEEGRKRDAVTRSFTVDSRGDWALRAIEWSPDGRATTESGHIRPYTQDRVRLAKKAADWFSRDFTEVVSR